MYSLVTSTLLPRTFYITADADMNEFLKECLGTILADDSLKATVSKDNVYTCFPERHIVLVQY